MLTTEDDYERVAALYRKGVTIAGISQEMKVSEVSVSRCLRRLGLREKTVTEPYAYVDIDKPKRHSRRKLSADAVAEIIVRFEGGESVLALSKAFNVSRGVIVKRLLEAGIKPRDCSESLRTRWKSASTDDRRKMHEPAAKAILGMKRPELWNRTLKGRPVPRAWTERSAKTNEGRGSRSVVEGKVYEYLSDFGFTVVQQKAISIYNADLAIPHTKWVIEMFGGSWHASGRHKDRYIPRMRELLRQGWSVVVVWVNNRRHDLTLSGMNEIYTTILQENQTPQVKVILGTGDYAPQVRSYLNDQDTCEQILRYEDE